MKILTDMQESDQVVHVISGTQAEKLLSDGFVRRVTIDPAPTGSKVAVNLTAKGRGYKTDVDGAVVTPTDTPDSDAE